MADPIQIANVFIEIANSEKEGSITNLKLNKLLYFAQGWSLVRNGRPLFEEDILAWQFGPIVQSVYRTFCVCGSDPICTVSENTGKGILSDEEIQLIIDTYRRYGRYSASALVEMTHEKGSPWQTAYSGQHNAIIGKNEILDYFSKMRPLDSFAKKDISELITIGRFAENGATILPHDDWDDDDYE